MRIARMLMAALALVAGGLGWMIWSRRRTWDDLTGFERRMAVSEGLAHIELLHAASNRILQNTLAGGRGRNREGSRSLPLQPVRLVDAVKE